MFGLSSGDTIAIIMAIVVAGGNLISWRRNSNDNTRLLLTDAATDAKDRAALDNLNKILADLHDQLEKANTSFHAHELKCAEDKATIITEQKAIATTLTQMSNRFSSLQQQISNLALNLAPAKAIRIGAMDESALDR